MLCFHPAMFFCLDGVFLGYPSKEKYFVWVANLSQEKLSRAEGSAVNYTNLGKRLFQVDVKQISV